MKSFAFGVVVVLLMPYLTMLVLNHYVPEFSFVGMPVAFVCILGSFALARLGSLATIALRLVRKLFGSKRSLDDAPTMGEKVLFVGGPATLAIGLYGVTGLVLSSWATASPPRFVVMMIGLGVVYGALMAWGLLNNLADVV